MFQSSGAARCGTCAYTPTRLCIQPSRLLSCPFRLSSTHPLLAPPGRYSSTNGKRFSCRRVTPLNIKWHREPIVPSRTSATASEPTSLSYFLFLRRIRAFFAPVQARETKERDSLRCHLCPRVIYDRRRKRRSGSLHDVYRSHKGSSMHGRSHGGQSETPRTRISSWTITNAWEVT